MSTRTRTHEIIATIIFATLLSASITSAASYSVAFLDQAGHTGGNNWQLIFSQGFSTALGRSPDPGLGNGAPIKLTQFEFYKSGLEDGASNIALAIFNTMYPYTVGLSTDSESFVGLSMNTVPSTSGIAVGDPIPFAFDLPLTYGNDYSAVFVNVGPPDGENISTLTPVRVASLVVEYAETSPGDYRPILNYGTDTEYQYTASDYIQESGYFSAYGYAGDADFKATFDTPPSLPGDLDDDGIVDADDIDILWAIVRNTGTDPNNNDDADLNGDSFANEDDVDYMLANLLDAGLNRAYGDADLDGGVGGLDFIAWRQRAGTGWANGDFDGDGGIGGIDFTLWRTRLTAYPGIVGPHSGATVGVPEPATWTLALIALATLASRVACSRAA